MSKYPLTILEMASLMVFVAKACCSLVKLAWTRAASLAIQAGGGTDDGSNKAESDEDSIASFSSNDAIPPDTPLVAVVVVALLTATKK